MRPGKPYTPDRRLIAAYEEATLLNAEGLRGLCPSYIELSEADTRYRDAELIGRGAVKDVYKTFNNHTRRWVAMARLRADRGPEFYDLFVHEAWLTASLNHPNIITIHDVGIDCNGRPFFTMDLKSGASLADRAAGPDPAGRWELLDVFMKVCDAVAYAHSKNIMHLDLKPRNIQADVYGEVLVCDWGLAKEVGEQDEDEVRLPAVLRPLDNMTLMGQIKGSLGYMAPEQVVPGSAKGFYSDVFALGCILHLILTGHSPFTGTREEMLEATRTANIIPPRTRYPERRIPAALEAVVMKATARRPEDRYDSALALRREISNFLAGYSTLAEQPGFFREARLFVIRNAIPVAIVFLAVVALSVVSVFSIQRINRHRRQAEEFESKAETAEALYQDELAHSEQERIRLAKELASSAGDLKRLGIYLRPVETVREARKLVDSAFALDSECAEARLQDFSLHCTTLNFKEALKNPLKEDDMLSDYRLFTDAFPHFGYTEEDRPEIETLAAFLRRAAELNPDRSALMERIVAYDAATRRSHAGYESVVESLINYLNARRDGSVRLQYNPEELSVVLSVEGRARLLILHQWGSNECMLRFLPVRSIKIKANRFLVGDLHRMQIETLDLRDCGRLVLKSTVDLPLLHRVLIRRGQIAPEELRKKINADGLFEIIESI